MITVSLASSLFSILLVSLVQTCSGANTVTVYYQFGTQSVLAAAATPTPFTGNYTGLSAYSPVTLNAPAPPGPSAFPTQFDIQTTNAVPTNASIPQNGSFFGFSIEMSVVNQVIGFNSTILQAPFLNLMANLQQRVGRINIRVGGNTQEAATLVPKTPDGKILEKDVQGSTNPTQTPPILFTPDLLYMLGNVSRLVNVRWHLGVPFNDTSHFRLGIVEQGQAILGDYLIGLQIGNEPDLYANPSHNLRPANYSAQGYFDDFGLMVNALNADPLVSARSKSLLIGPSIQIFWTPEEVWDTGFVQTYSPELAFLSVERYPTDNCAVAFPTSGMTPNDPQTTFPTFLTHNSALGLVQGYLNSTAFAQANGKEFLMFETNTASCGGFPGISNSFGAALWGVDYALQMAAVDFSGALFHVGGQSASYNPFTPPPTNQSTFHQWTIGPIYYSALVVAEALGPTNTSRVMDLNANVGNQFSPAYGIWENGALARVVLVNFVSDSSGASDINVTLAMTDGQMPSSVKVKYLLSPSVSDIANFTWAGQTFGGNFQSDGRPVGAENVSTIACTPATASSSASCTVRVPGPGAAIVFLTSLDETAGGASTTFSTTAFTKTRNTVSIDPSLLATSNGYGGKQAKLGSTSAGATKNGVPERRGVMVGVGVVGAVAAVVGSVMLGAPFMNC